MNKTVLIPVYEKNHIKKLPDLIKKLNKEGKRAIILGLNSEIRELLDEARITYKSPLDYLTREEYRKVFTNGRRLIKNLPTLHRLMKQITIYKDLPLLEMDESRVYRGHYIEKIIEYLELLQKVIKKEKPEEVVVMDNVTYQGKTIFTVANYMNIPVFILGMDKVSYLKHFFRANILPYLIKKFRHFRDIQRRIWYKRRVMNGKGKKRILTITYDVNQVKALKPVIDRLNQSKKYDIIVIRSDSIVSDRTKRLLDSMKIPYNTFESYIDRNVITAMKNSEKLMKQKWEILRNDNKFQLSLRYKDIPIFYIFENIFSSLFVKSGHLADLVKQVEIIENILRIEKPDLVIVLGEVSSLRKILVRKCKERNIPTLFLQHGAFGEDTIFDIIIADKIAVQGNFTKKILLKMGCNPKDIVITGQPRYDLLANRKFDKDKVFKEFDLNPNKKLVLLTTQPMRFWGGEGKEALIRGVLLAMKELTQYQLLIKLHPMEEKEYNFYARITKEIGVDAKIVYDADIYELINACDVMVTGFSTTVFEAVILDKPVITINLTHKPDLMPYAESGIAVGVSRVEDIKPAIKKALENTGLRKRLEKNRKKFIREHLYKIDGKSTERVVNLIEAMLHN